MTSCTDAIEHIKWTLERSPYAYEILRNEFIDLRVLLVNCEIKQQEKDRNNDTE